LPFVRYYPDQKLPKLIGELNPKGNLQLSDSIMRVTWNNIEKYLLDREFFIFISLVILKYFITGAKLKFLFKTVTKKCQN
jgi:hypothetical protein